ncbi:MAG: hypothetical protein IKI75_01230 [Lachnospiraceae bacterium]|nr:hypothetical protein [Lachnospiraceae bacterium]
MTMREFREILRNVDRSYDDFVSLVITYIKIPGNRSKALQIRDYIESSPFADSSDVLQFMINELGMADVSDTMAMGVI